MLQWAPATVMALAHFLFMGESSSVVFIGHSTVLLEIGDVHAITDPNFSDWVWTLRRKSNPGMRPEDLPPIDLILISHGHYDHLDMRSLKTLPRSSVVIVPPGLEKFPRKAGYTDVRTLTWWEETEVKTARITAVPAAHFAGRSPFTPKSLYQGYVVQADTGRGRTVAVYYAGDTGLFDDMTRIGNTFSPDVAVLPIGAYNPWAKYGHHMTPEDAVEAFKRTGAKFLIPVHWGAFKMSMEPMDEPPKRLLKEAEKAGRMDAIRILRPGERLDF